MKIKISHEVPLCLLEASRNFNDYDYLLPHLMDEKEEYKNFFLKSKELGRYIIMDNSLHELGRPYDEKRLLYWLEQIQPNEFFVPDFWEDKTQSIVSARKWISYKEQFPNTTFIAVVQAKNIGEAMSCYQTYKDLGYEKIAFSYGADYYNAESTHPNKALGKALGRIEAISLLKKLNIISRTDRVHLLGCAVPQEFGWYHEFPFIESIDTSSPIMAALDGVEYASYGLYNKPKACMNDNIDINIRNVNLDLLYSNLTKFRLINNFIEN